MATTDILYYGGAIPSGFIETWYANMKVWEDMYLDNQMARAALAVRNVPETTEQYDMPKIDVSAEEIVPQARRAAPKENLTIGGTEESYKVYRLPTGFFLSEEDTKKSPELQGWHIDAAMSKIYRAEDKMFYAGFTAPAITGFKTAAEANSNGKIVASGASGNDTNNIGAWLTTDTNRDIYEDLRVARGKLKSKFRANLQNLRLAGNPTSMDALWQKDPYSDNSDPIFRSVAPLFGRSPDAPITEWTIINDQIDDGYVFLITAKNPMAAELIEAKPITIDDNYPRVPIGNFQVILYEDVGLAIHDNDAFVEIAIT